MLTVAHPVFDVRIYKKECRALWDAGYHVTLIAPAQDDNEPGMSSDITIRFVPMHSSRIKRFLFGGWKVFRTALTTRAAVYHLHDPELLPWAQMLRLSGATVVFDMHENMPAALLTKPWIASGLRSLVSRSFRFAERLLLSGLQVVFAEHSYVSNYPWIRKPTVVLNMPDVETLKTCKQDKNRVFTIAYIGRVVPERGSLVTLEALSILQSKGLHVEWDCVGIIPPKHEEEMKAFIHRHRLNGIRLHGYQPAEKAWQIASAAHVGIAVLRPIPNYIHSFPTKMFEYMALGIPMIVSDFPLYKEVVDEHECGLCVDPLNPSALADAIEKMIREPEKAKRMGQQGVIATDIEFNWKAEAEKLLNMYSRILTPGEPPLTPSEETADSR